MNAVNWFVLLLSLAVVNSLIAGVGVRRFLSLHPLIGNQQDLESFKEMVRRQMYQALLQIGFLGIANIVGLYGLLTHRIHLLLIIGLDVAVIILSQGMKKTEEQARAMNVVNVALEGQYKDICETWVKKALPDF